MLKQPIFLLLIALIAGCGGGMYTKDSNEIDGPNADTSYITPWGNATVTKDAFIFGSDYPSDIEIPDIDGLRNTAFVVTMSSPTGVVAIDLESNPLELSKKYKGIISPDGTGIPNNLSVLNPSRAFLLTSSHVIDFNPKTGIVNSAVKLTDKITLKESMPISAEYDVDGDGNNESSVKTFAMNYPADLLTIGDGLYVSMSNLLSPINPAIAAPGLIRIFDTKDSLKEYSTPIVTTDFNPTAITKISDTEIAITNSGVTDVWDGAAHPITNSSIDILDTSTNQIIANIPIGNAALSFKKMAVTSDGKKAYIGSSSFGEVYEVDIENKNALRTHDDPITITGNKEGSDYLSSFVTSYDNWYLFAASFDNSSIYAVDISSEIPDVMPEVFPEPFILGFPKGVTDENPTGTNTGIGDVSIRPGIPGIDYTGPDIFALTGTPGTLVTINTHGTKDAGQNQIEKMQIVAGKSTLFEGDEVVGLTLTITFADGTIVEEIKDTFTNPFSGYPLRVMWSSSNWKVASINYSAEVTPKLIGETTITAKIGQMSASAVLNILAKPSESENEEWVEEDNDNKSTENESDQGDAGETDFFYIPQINIYLSPEMMETLIELMNGKQQDKIEILSKAPPGTDPYIDEVVLFNPGANAGYGSNNLPGVIQGPPAGISHVLSLGIKGEITVKMTDFIIADGDGPDFTVFENPIIDAATGKPFAEPGIVSVSSDGTNYVEFDCNLADKKSYTGCAGTIPSNYNKDPLNPDESGGNLFDLKNVGLKTARFIKIKDAGETPQELIGPNNAGFDLDAIAVINGTLPK